MVIEHSFMNKSYTAKIHINTYINTYILYIEIYRHHLLCAHSSYQHYTDSITVLQI